MGNLFVDDIENLEAYSDQQILKDVRALVGIGYREGAPIDYKKDISDKDNWPQAAAAFANTFGGLIIFGVDEKQGRPVRVVGFNPKGVETKTKLTSILLSRIQPRPEIQIRVVSLDTDQTKEVAILRILEGDRPPYMHSKGDEHRVYIRSVAQKSEADYLQLISLFERRRRTDALATSFLAELVGSASPLQLYDPLGSNTISRQFYRFVVAPEDRRAARRLTVSAETEFKELLNRIFNFNQRLTQPERRRIFTSVRWSPTNPIEQKFVVSAVGSVGLVSHACLQGDTKRYFSLDSFCRDLINFRVFSARFYEARRYYGTCLLDVNLSLLDGAAVWTGPQQEISVSDILESPIPEISPGSFSTQILIGQQTLTEDVMYDELEATLNELAREVGTVLSSSFRAATSKFVKSQLAL